MRIIIDTNILIKDYKSDFYGIKSLLKFSNLMNIKVLIPKIVLDEYYGNIDNILEQEIRNIASSYKAAKNLFPSKKFKELIIKNNANLEKIKKDALENYKKNIDKLIRTYDIEVLPYPNVEHTEIIDRLYSSKKPFIKTIDSKNKNYSEKGYKDYLIYKTVECYSESNSESDCEIYFVTNNYSDFCDNSFKDDEFCSFSKDYRCQTVKVIRDIKNIINLNRHKMEIKTLDKVIDAEKLFDSLAEYVNMNTNGLFEIIFDFIHFDDLDYKMKHCKTNNIHCESVDETMFDINFDCDFIIDCNTKFDTASYNSLTLLKPIIESIFSRNQIVLSTDIIDSKQYNMKFSILINWKANFMIFDETETDLYDFSKRWVLTENITIKEYS